MSKQTSEAIAQIKRAGILSAGVRRFSDAPLLPGVRSAARLPKAAKSVLVCLFPYYAGDFPGRNLSLYAVIPDYHAVAGGMLEEACRCLSARFPGEAFAPFVDASPLDEVTAAERAGLGERGRNGQLLTAEYGSFVFIGEIVTTMELEPTPSERLNLCGGCRACLAACPTGALAGGMVRKERCRSHLTQKKGALSEQERREIAAGGFVWGCDRCTLACPRNQNPAPTPIEAFRKGAEPVVTGENLGRLLQNRAFSYRGRALLERNLAILAEREEPRRKNSARLLP